MLWQTLPLPWQACFEEAWTAYCAGSFPIGATVVDAAGQIVARGRNRNHERHANGQQLYGHPLAHAEMNALIALDYQQHAVRDGYAIYTTMEPCPLCAGAIYMSGVREVHYAARDGYAGSTDMFGTTPYMSRKPMRIYGPPSDVLESMSTIMQVVFLQSHRPTADVVLDAMEQVVPHGVQLGNYVGESGLLSFLRDEGIGAAEVVSRLAELIAGRAQT